MKDDETHKKKIKISIEMKNGPRTHVFLYYPLLIHSPTLYVRSLCSRIAQ
jgi:hypothetical protein